MLPQLSCSLTADDFAYFFQAESSWAVWCSLTKGSYGWLAAKLVCCSKLEKSFIWSSQIAYLSVLPTSTALNKSSEVTYSVCKTINLLYLALQDYSIDERGWKNPLHPEFQVLQHFCEVTTVFILFTLILPCNYFIYIFPLLYKPFPAAPQRAPKHHIWWRIGRDRSG